MTSEVEAARAKKEEARHAFLNAPASEWMKTWLEYQKAVMEYAAALVKSNPVK